MPVLDQAEQTTFVHTESRRRFTVEQAYRIAELLFPGERWELIEGDIISKMGQKPPHAVLVGMLTGLLSKLFPDRVRIQLPLSLNDDYTEPEPDVVLLNKNMLEFARHHPGPADVALLIEISDTSLDTDTKIKKRLYARAGISEYWIMDIPHRCIRVCREPEGDEYKLVRIFSETEEVSSPSAPGVSVCLKNLLP
jgi:Uma2 family endonuclease